MAKLIYWSMLNPTTNDTYQMGEINDAEYSAGWDGDTKAYLDNLDADNMEYTRDESILARVEQNFGGHEPLPGSICVVLLNGKPAEIYWAAYLKGDVAMKITVYRIYEATAELKQRPDSVGEIVNAQDSENWITIGEYPDAESAVTALRRDHGTATVWKFPGYFLCKAAFVEEVTETIEDGMVIDRDSESVEDCKMPAPYDEEDLITAESFGSDIPLNWEEIAAYMNEKIKSGDNANEVWETYWNGDYTDAPAVITERCEVEYQGGESRQTPGMAVDYMLVTVPSASADGEETELYAEIPAEDESDANYDELKAAIIAQAKQHGIDPKFLHFWYDD